MTSSHRTRNPAKMRSRWRGLRGLPFTAIQVFNYACLHQVSCAHSRPPLCSLTEQPVQPLPEPHDSRERKVSAELRELFREGAAACFAA